MSATGGEGGRNPWNATPDGLEAAESRPCAFCALSLTPGDGGFVNWMGGVMLYCSRFRTWQRAWEAQEGCESVWRAWDGDDEPLPDDV